MNIDFGEGTDQDTLETIFGGLRDYRVRIDLSRQQMRQPRFYDNMGRRSFDATLWSPGVEHGEFGIWVYPINERTDSPESQRFIPLDVIQTLYIY